MPVINGRDNEPDVVNLPPSAQARADRQAYDADARRRLREPSRELWARAGVV